MNKIRIYTCALALFASAAILTGCELLGLDLQEKYDYDENAGMYSNELNKSVWHFLNSRTDEFSLFIEGIKYAGLEDRYNEPNSTYVALTNIAVTQYFSNHLLPNPIHDPNDPATGPAFIPAFSLEQFPKEQIREMLLYHIVKGTWTWSNLPPVKTWYDTNAAADTAKVNMYLMKNERSPTIGFNDFTSHHQPAVRPRSSNLKANNGSYVHAVDSYLDYPTKEDLGMN